MIVNDDEEIDQMIDDCVNRLSKLTDWEVDFISDIEHKKHKHGLSYKQIEIINKIWDRVTS